MDNLLCYLGYSFPEPETDTDKADMRLHLPVNKDTTVFVLNYISQFVGNLEHCDFSGAITALDEIARCLFDATKKMEFGFEDNSHEMLSKQVELSEMLVNSFFPEVVQRFFTVPKLHQLPQSDKHLYPNEILAGFMDFLLQVLYHETNISSDEVQQQTIMQKELSFLLAVLGDIPFQCTHHDLVGQVTILLAEFEMLANEAGSLVYDTVFSTHQMAVNKFYARRIDWIEKVELLTAKIREHCFEFSKLPMSVISRSNVVDSFFIVHSLIEDIENLKNHKINFNHGDAIMEHMETLHGKLTLSKSFIKVMQDNEDKEGLIQIRDLTYEAEYLIISLVVGNVHVWYLNLRLPSIIHMITLACSELQQISDSKFMKSSDKKESFPTTGNTATMDENHFQDFNDDITQRILKDQSNYMKILEVSYKQLPCNLKPCFLYFATFPKNSEISQEKLTRLWIGEGFILKEGSTRLEEIAETYLLDLINRNWVLITKRGSNGAIKNCKIQSLLHEFCVRKANEENFVKVINSDFSMYERCQHLCLLPTLGNVRRPFGLHCRSFRDLQTQVSSCFQTMALLKVVDHSLEDIGNTDLAFPAQLRYLGVGHLSNKMVANLVNLDSIILWSKYKLYVPSVVLRMVKLRHLVTEGELVFEEDCSSNMAETTNLRTLSRIGINDKKDEEIFRCCPHLHKLKCIFTDYTKFPDLSFLGELESLKMSFVKGLSAKILSSKVNFPSTIKKLSLSNSNLPWEMMSILGRLPNLHVISLNHDAFRGEVWETRDGEFQKLKCLKAYNHDLSLWISCSEHFPVLECLVLRYCQELVEIPSDFCNIPTLQRIQLTDCTKEACFSALQIQIGKQIQLVIEHHGQTTDEFILEELTNPTHDDLINLLRCMEEYFKAGGPEVFINKSPIIDQMEDETTTDEDEDDDAFVLRDVLSYMEEYFKAEGSEEFVKKRTNIDQTEDESTTTADDEPLISVDHHTYFVVVSYALQFSSDLENLAILGLRCIAESYINKQFLPRHPRYVDEITKSRREFSDMLMNTFIPLVQRFFEFPKIEQLPDNDDKPLKKNEILASFMDFLLQMLFCEVNTDSAGAEQFSPLQKELSFLLAVLGDIPFQHSTHPELDEQLNNLLAEFTMLANEVGRFLFSCVFPLQPMKVSRFHAEANVLLEISKLLNTKIKEHCTNFSELHVSVIVRFKVVDSFFIVSSLVDDLQNIIMNGQLGSFTPGDSIMEQIKTLHGELTLSQSFINVMRDNEEREGLIQIRDLAYEAEYLINSLLVGNIHIWYLNLRLPSIIHKVKLLCVALQISETAVMKASEGKVFFPTTGNTATIDDDQFLDFNYDISQGILNDLIGNSNTSRQAISIFGMPGLGKTSTASKFYNCHSSYFDRRAWCVGSQNYSVKNLLIKILMCLISPADESSISKNNVAELGVKIHQTLFGRRYLIVLDDVWHSDVFEKLQIYFPDDRNGSRVMITTRNENVSPSGSIIYKLPFLSENQCWNLLEKKVFCKDPCPSHLVGIGKRIAAKCSGVPLAVVSIAGVLVNSEKEESEWEIVNEGLEKILLDDQSDYRKIMELSYEQLPHCIKPCFLYFGRFPDDAEISTKELARSWISQGFIEKDGNKSPEEIAEMYLSNLINRSLVITATRRSIGGTKTCRVHDLLHDICIKKADEQNFMNSTNLSPCGKHQHLCLPYSSNTNWRPLGLHCRSFRGHSKQSSGFRTMALLKAVDLLQKMRFEPQRFDFPFQLRYLAFSGKQVAERMVDSLVNLEILCVRGDVFSEVVVPSAILRMAKLRHLFVRDAAVFEEDCNNNNISGTTNLISISRVVVKKKNDEEILRKSVHLRTLKCNCMGEAIFPDFRSLAELQSLRINFEPYFGGEIILLSKDSLPSTITKLCLSWSRLPWEQMSIIGELPSLEVLKLEYNAFEGEEWETKDDQFKELRFLKIDATNLKQWSSDSSHFPRLEQLVLHRCYNLMEIPSDLGCIPTLQRIEVIYCRREACISAIEIEQEQLQYDNQLQVDIIHDKWKKEELMGESMRESESELRRNQ